MAYFLFVDNFWSFKLDIRMNENSYYFLGGLLKPFGQYMVQSSYQWCFFKQKCTWVYIDLTDKIGQ